MDRFLALPLAILIAYATSASATTSVTCTNVVTIDLDGTGYFNDMDGTFDTSKFYINDVEVDYSTYDALPGPCKGEVTTSTFDATIALGDCNPTVTANDTYINYAYKIWNKPMLWENENPAIARYEVFSTRVDCFYTRLMTDDTTDSYIVPRIVKTHVWDGTSMYEGTFTFELDFMTDDTYDSAVSGSATIDVGAWMYIGLSLNVGSADTSNFVAFKNCFAKSTSTTGGLEYHLIRDYSVVDESWDEEGSIIMETSGTTQQAQLKVKSFVWNNAVADSSQEIYVQCDATVCNNDVSGNCVDYTTATGYVASNRRRRRRRDTESQQVVTLMAGPIEVM